MLRMVTQVKVYLVLIAIIAALSGGLWWSISAGATARAERDTAVQALSRVEAQRKADAQLLTARRAEIASERRKSAASQAALAAALGASQGWAGTSVPPEVRSALGGAVGGLQ